jgi:hypothetical protein
MLAAGHVSRFGRKKIKNFLKTQFLLACRVEGRKTARGKIKVLFQPF